MKKELIFEITSLKVFSPRPLAIVLFKCHYIILRLAIVTKTTLNFNTDHKMLQNVTKCNFGILTLQNAMKI